MTALIATKALGELMLASTQVPNKIDVFRLAYHPSFELSSTWQKFL